MFNCLIVELFICLFVYLFVCLFVCLFVIYFPSYRIDEGASAETKLALALPSEEEMGA